MLSWAWPPARPTLCIAHTMCGHSTGASLSVRKTLAWRACRARFTVVLACARCRVAEGSEGSQRGGVHTHCHAHLTRRASPGILKGCSCGHVGSAPDCGTTAQVGPDPYWGAAGLVGTSSAAPATQLDNNTVAAPFGGIAVIAFGHAVELPPAQFGKSSYINMTGAGPAAAAVGRCRAKQSPVCVEAACLERIT